jgi:GH24 family phage-related lysozyme (muramidase)
MKLVPDARRVALRSWSLWANRAGFVSLLYPLVAFELTGAGPDPVLFGWIGLVLYVLAELLRYLDQGGLDGRRDTLFSPVLIALAALLLVMGMGKVPEETAPAPAAGVPSEADWAAVAVPLVAKWEGLRTEAYLDTIAEPDVWTVCYGETKGVRPGDSYTAAECAAMLRKRLRTYRAGWHGYLMPETLQSRLTPERDGAYTSFSYNVGVAGAGRSTATRRLNVGDIAGGCHAIGWWNKAGGRVIRGLVNRRTEETALCLRGL